MSGSPRTRREFVRVTTAGVGGTLAALGCRDRSPPANGRQSRALGVAVAGVGGLATGQVLPALTETRLARPAGLVTGDPARVRSLAADYGIPTDAVYTYDEMPAMSANPDIHVVYIATPNSLHREQTIAAAQAGKHVLCEKPMATSAAECEEMIDACRDAGVRLGVGYRLQFEAHHLECMRLARDGTFGDLKLIEAAFGFRLADPAQWRLRRDLAGGGALIDAGIYALQACRYLTGEEPIEVAAFETKTDPVRFAEVEESLTWQMRFPSGCLASCSTSYNATAISRFRAYGEHGWFGLEPAYGYGGLNGTRLDGRPLEFDHENHFAAMLDAFAEAILEDRPFRADGVEGLRDLRAIDAIYASVRTGGSRSVQSA